MGVCWLGAHIWGGGGMLVRGTHLGCVGVCWLGEHIWGVWGYVG